MDNKTRAVEHPGVKQVNDVFFNAIIVVVDGEV